MKKHLVSLACLAFISGSCRTRSSQLSSMEAVSASAEMDLWNQYVQSEIGSDKIQADCMPRIYRADPMVERKGMLMFFHGFTACPQQYFAISERLSKLGYDVYLPLLPGQGREPLDGPKGVDDNYKTLPSTEYHGNGSRREDLDGDGISDRYRKFVMEMNEIARLAPRGDKVIAGLSGGGALATGAAIAGSDVWDRVLVYAPYYKNPGINGPASAFMNTVLPGLKNDWGAECRETRKEANGRAGLCALTIGAIRAMTDYGVEQAKNAGQIKAPMQFVGVDFDPTADVGAIHSTFKSVKNARMCLYPNGVPHSIINPASDAPKLDPYWVAAMQEDSIAFITQGRWFLTSGVSQEKYGLPTCRYAL